VNRTRVFGGARGFSLVELAIVVALVAMMSLIAAPWFVKIYQRNQVKSAAFEVQTTLIAARMRAVKRNVPVSVIITSVTPPIELKTVEPPPATPNPTPVPPVLKLPASAVQFVATPLSGGGTVTFGSDGRLLNFANQTPAVYQMEGPVGQTTPIPIWVRINSGGRVEVVTPTVTP
jgi:prepilin-type N-terminal cleavage/methylation domain-containing protein